MPCFNINLQQGFSFKRLPLIKEIIYFTIKSSVFFKKIKYRKTGATSIYI